MISTILSFSVKGPTDCPGCIRSHSTENPCGLVIGGDVVAVLGDAKADDGRDFSAAAGQSLIDKGGPEIAVCLW